jgi:hypothetical protein
MRETVHIVGDKFSAGRTFKKVTFQIAKGAITISAYHLDPYTPEEVELEIALSRTETKRLLKTLKETA